VRGLVVHQDARYEVCAIKCPENKSAVVFPSVFNTSKIHRTFLFFA